LDLNLHPASVAEIGIGIICACLPAFNVLFIRWSSEYASRNSRKTNYSAEIKLSRIKTSSRGGMPSLPRTVNNPLSRSQSSYVEVRLPRDLLFLEENRESGGGRDRNSGRESGRDSGREWEGRRELKSQLSVEAMSRHTRSSEGGGLDSEAEREFRKVHDWMQRPVFPDDGIGRAA
jgi:hypothetical protein